MLAGLPALAQVGAFPTGQPAQQQESPPAETETAPAAGLPSQTGQPSSMGQIGLPSPISGIGLPSPLGSPASPGGEAAAPESPFGLSPDIFPGLLGGRPTPSAQQPVTEPGLSNAPSGAQPETTAPAGAIEPQPGIAPTPQPAFLNPGFGFGSLPGYGVENYPGYGFGNLAPGGALLPPNATVPSAAQNPLASATLGPVSPGAIPVQSYDSRAPWILIRPTISAFAGVTDNARDLPQGSWDGLGRVSGTTAISVDTVRLQGQLSGGVNYQRYLRNSDQNQLNANLLAYGLGTVVQDHLFIDARAGMTQTSRNGGVAFASPSVIRTSDQVQVITTSLSPIARYSFGGYVDSEFRSNFSTVMYQNGSLLGSSGSAPSSGNLNNATSNEATVNLATGRLFTTVASKLTLDALMVDSKSAARTTQLRAIDNSAYQFSQKFTGLALAGYENLRYPLQPAANFVGPSFALGGRYAPSPGNFLLATYGRQEGLWGFTGALRYEITARTIMLASYQRNRASQQQQTINNLNTSGVDTAGNLVDQLSGLPVSLANSQLALSSAVSRFDTARAGLHTQLERDSFGLFAFYSRQNPLGTPIGSAALASPVVRSSSVGANLSWGRSLTPRLNSSAQLGYAIQTNSDQKTLTASLNVSYELGERLNAVLYYQFIDIDSNAASSSYRRNQVEIGLTRSF